MYVCMYVCQLHGVPRRGHGEVQIVDESRPGVPIHTRGIVPGQRHSTHTYIHTLTHITEECILYRGGIVFPYLIGTDTP